MNLILSRGTDQVGLEILTTAVEAKQSALAGSKIICVVSSSGQQDKAANALRTLKKLLREVEDSRTLAKAPFLEFGRRIDGLAKDFALEIEAESKRVNGLLNTYQAEQFRIQQEAERKRQAEIARIEAERRAAERAEQKRLAELEAQRRRELEAAKAKDRAEAYRIALAQQEAREKEKLEAEKAKMTVAPIVMPAPVQAAPRAEGMIVRKVWKFEVLDAGKVLLAHPEFCRVDVIAIDVIRALAGGLRECPGLRIWEETQTGVRL